MIEIRNRKVYDDLRENLIQLGTRLARELDSQLQRARVAFDEGDYEGSGRLERRALFSVRRLREVADADSSYGLIDEADVYDVFVTYDHIKNSRDAPDAIKAAIEDAIGNADGNINVSYYGHITLDGSTCEDAPEVQAFCNEWAAGRPDFPKGRPKAFAFQLRKQA